jgi:hypothetical protein
MDASSKTGRHFRRPVYCGDGGNRTRVRKIRPQISTSLVSQFLRHPLGPARQGHQEIIRCVLHPGRGNPDGIPAFVSLMARAVRRGSRSTGPPRETALTHSDSLRREGESAVVSAVGTCCFCAALTSTAPLGLQLVTSFLRRSLSSPYQEYSTQSPDAPVILMRIAIMPAVCT